MGDFLYGRCSKGAGRTHNVIDLKFYLLLDLSFKASSPPPLTPPLQSVYRYRGGTAKKTLKNHFESYMNVVVETCVETR